MKAIVDRKIYDTGTAELIADQRISLHNFYSTSESLYRTKSGRWFLHGESSAGGRYGRQDGSTQMGGEDIIALSTEEVMKWAEESAQLLTEEETTHIVELLQLPEA